MLTKEQQYKKDYFEKHIPHRVTLLITFRERFSSLSKTYSAPNTTPDLFRCSKDISLMMVRFLLGELGINLREGDSDISEKGGNEFAKKLLVREVIKDPSYANILIVLTAANRAVAHIEKNNVNHPLQLDEDNEILFNAINFTEKKVKSNLYDKAGFDFTTTMDEEKKNMNRRKIKIVEGEK